MTSSGFDSSLAFTLLPSNDGQKFHDTPGDPGGATAWGVTQQSWSSWIGRPASIADMQALTATEVGSFYRYRYWNTIDGDNLPPGVDLMVFDNGVLSGPVTSAKQLQELLGVKVDGEIGPITLAAAQQSNAYTLITRLRTAQANHYRSLSDFPEFGKGWLSRLDRRADAAMAMLVLGETGWGDTLTPSDMMDLEMIAEEEI